MKNFNDPHYNIIARSRCDRWWLILFVLVISTSGPLVVSAAPPSTADWVSGECIGINVSCNPGSPPPSIAKLLTYADFENGDYQSHGMRPVGNGEPQIATTPEPVCRGKYSLKLPLDYYNSAYRYRNQLVFGYNLEYGKEYWVGFAFYIPPEITNPRASFDFHGTPDTNLGEVSRSSSLGLYAGFYDPKNQIHMRILSSKDPVNAVEGGKLQTDRYFVEPVAELVTGKWIEAVLHFNVTYLQDGFVEVWIDGKQVLSEQNIGTAYNDNTGPYPKIGIYMFEWAKGAPAPGEAYKLAYYDEIRIVEGNAKRDDVAPRCNI